MFLSWGTLVAAHSRRVLLVSSLLLVAAMTAVVAVGSDLSALGFVSDDAESSRVAETVENDFGFSNNNLVFLFDAGGPVNDPNIQAAIDESIAPLRGRPDVLMVQTAWEDNNPAMVSTDGTSTYVVVSLDPGAILSPGEMEEIEHLVTSTAAAHGLEVSFGGLQPVQNDLTEKSEEGVMRAELFSIPITLVILVLVFGSLVAAGLPLVIGVVTILSATAVIFVLSQMGYQSIFAANVVTMLGLGLGIDYSLFMVTRFREELRTRSTDEAVAVTTATVGKAIFFAGITVILGLAATQFFPLPALQSIGQAGMIVTAMALIFGLSTLPAMLAIIGPRINAVHIGRRRNAAAASEGGFWHGVAHAVMVRPILILGASMIVLLVVAFPALHMNLTPGGVEMLPEETRSRVVTERLKSDFAADEADALSVLVHLGDDRPVSPTGVQAIQSVITDIENVEGVTGVESVFSPHLEATTGWNWSAWNGDPDSLPAPVTSSIESTVRDQVVLMQVTTSLSGDEAQSIVRDIRGLNYPTVDILVGGAAAESADTLDGIKDGIAPAILFVLVGAYIILFLSFGSVLLPLKAIFMGALSIVASVGAVVFIFQDGAMESLLNFQANGTIVAINPILIACILFGLSMDYEVLMLSRIQEEYERTGDNTHSVATGLSRTGQVITGAAAIMVIVFGGFILADIVVIKSLGFGLALAVLVDATIVRGLLVPSTMRLMGRWNWWAPAPLRSLVHRLGMAHTSEVGQPAQ